MLNINMLNKANKKRVLFIGSFNLEDKKGNVGGQMYACTSLVKSNLSDEVDWLLVDTTASTNLKRKFINRLFNAIKRLLIISYYLLFFRVDVVLAFCASGYSFLEKGYALKMAKIIGKKTVIAPRSGYLIDDVLNNSSFKNKALSIFKACDTIICQGEFWHSFFLNELSQEKSKLKVIHNWIDVNKYLTDKKESFKPINLLFLGSLDINKGIWDLFNAVVNLLDQDIILNIGGNGNEFHALKQKIEKNKIGDKIKLLDWVYGDDKIELLRNTDVFILPSYIEGLPNSILEALASKCAVITTNVGAIPDIISHENNGKIIEPGDVHGLSDAISDYCNNPEKISRHSENGFKTVVEKNSIDHVVETFKKVLDR